MFSQRRVIRGQTANNAQARGPPMGSVKFPQATDQRLKPIASGKRTPEGDGGAEARWRQERA